MKKAIIIFCAVLTFAVTLSGCGGNSNVKDTSSNIVSSTSSTELETDITEETEETETTKSTEAENNSSATEISSKASSETTSLNNIEEYVEAMRPQIEAIGDSFKDTFEVSVYSEGDDTLVYQYNYKQQLEVDDAKAFEETMGTTLEGSYSIFGNMLETLRDTLNIDNPKLIVKYINADDSVLFEKELTLSVIEEYNNSKSE